MSVQIQQGGATPRRARFPLFIGFLAVAVLLGGLGAWSVTARIAGAVVSTGVVQVQSNRQVIQHPEGGVVGAILAKDGDIVEAGDTVIRLDDTELVAELAITSGQLYEILSRAARLEAERDELDEIVFPEELLALEATDPVVQRQLSGQRRQFEASRLSLEEERDLLNEQIAQIGSRIEGIDAQLEALHLRKELVSQELANQESLLERGLSQAARVLQLRSEEASLLGEIGKLNADIAELKGQIAAIRIELVKLKTGTVRNAIATLRDLQYSEIELSERRRSLLDKLSRLDIKTPVSGIVHATRVFALRSVIQPAQSIMYVIPQDQPLVVSARIDTSSIDQIHVRQEATLRFTVFDQRNTPELFGHVSKVSPDVITDEASGNSFYVVELLPEEGELDKLEGHVLLPGMPVEVFVKTEERSPIAYLSKPLTDYFARAFRG